MLRGTDCDDSLAMAAAVLTVRFCATSGTPLTSKMMHRLFIAALHVAIKTHSDRYFRNDAFALLSGLRCLEMNLLEAALLGGLEWRCLVEARHVAPVVANPAAYVIDRVPATRTDDRPRDGTAASLPVVTANSPGLESTNSTYFAASGSSNED